MSEEKINPFEWINSITTNKKDLIEESEYQESTVSQYDPFMVNKGLSYFPDTILFANEMNKLHNLPKREQYKYLLLSVRKRKRFSKWFKQDDAEKIMLVREYFQCNPTVAKQYMKVMKDDDYIKIRTKMEKGGKNNDTKGK